MEKIITGRSVSQSQIRQKMKQQKCYVPSHREVGQSQGSEERVHVQAR